MSSEDCNRTGQIFMVLRDIAGCIVSVVGMHRLINIFTVTCLFMLILNIPVNNFQTCQDITCVLSTKSCSVTQENTSNETT